MGIKKVTIQKGDNLTKLANKYNTTVNNIVDLNKDKIKDPNLIYAGDKIQIEDVNFNTKKTVDIIEDANKKNVDKSMMTDTIARQKQNDNYQKYHSKSDDTRVERDQSRTIADMENGKAIKSVESANKNYSHTLDSYAYNSTNKADGNNGYEDKVAEASKHGFKPLGSELSNKTIYGTEKINEYEQTLSAKDNSNDNYSQTLDSYNYQTNNKKTDGSNYSSRTIDDMTNGQAINRVANKENSGYYQQTQDIAEKSAKDYQDKKSGYERTIRRLEQEKNAHSQAYGRQVIYPEVDKSNTVANNTINNVNVENNATINDNSISAGTIDNQTLEQQIAMANAYENNNTTNVDPYIAAASQTIAPNVAMDATLTGGMVGGFDGKFVSMPNSVDLDDAIHTAFAEGAYASEEDARKIADTMLNRAKDNGTSLISEVKAKGQYMAYQSGNWGWIKYGSEKSQGSIGTQRVKEIFMEELSKAVNGYELSYPVKNFRGKDGKNYYW